MATATMKTNSKATHKGHCQVCGACQKLPSGVLAKHGYTTRWGFFEGTCPGFGHLPFEQDISLIENAIASARQSEQVTRDEAATVRAQSDPADCWHNAYFSGNRRGDSGYRWIKTKLGIPADSRFSQLCYWHPGDSRPARWEQVGYYGRDGAVGAARESNGSYADRYLIPRADRLHEYARWQEWRIANWSPQPLTPID